MTRAVLPNTSAREQWPLAGLKDSTTNHYAGTPPLLGGEDKDADTGTDTTVPDDTDDIASFSSQQTTTIDVQNLCPLHSRPSRERNRLDGPLRT